jgi:cytochrome P450
MSILLEELIARVKTIELAGTPAWTQSTFVSGPKRLPIRFTAE